MNILWLLAALSMGSGCAGDTYEGRWVSNTEPVYTGFLGDHIVGVWEGGFVESPEGGGVLVTTIYAFTFQEDGTFEETETIEHGMVEPTMAGCIEETRRAGTWTRNDELTLTLDDTGAQVTVTDCATADDNTVRTEDPGHQSIPALDYCEHSGRFGSGVDLDGLTLWADTVGLILRRQDVSHESLSFELDPDGIARFEGTRTYNALAGSLAGCTDTYTFETPYEAGLVADEVGFYTLRLEVSNETAVSRSGCTDASRNGNSTLAGPHSMGALRYVIGYSFTQGEISLDFGPHEYAVSRYPFVRAD